MKRGSYRQITGTSQSRGGAPVFIIHVQKSEILLSFLSKFRLLLFVKGFTKFGRTPQSTDSAFNGFLDPLGGRIHKTYSSGRLFSFGS